MHEMKLQEEFYNYFLSGTKKMEIRLNDEKRQRIKVGDKIKFFKEPNLKDYFIAEVINLTKYNNFEEMINNYDISSLADKSYTKGKLLDILQKYYPKEKQKIYETLAIEVKILNENKL